MKTTCSKTTDSELTNWTKTDSKQADSKQTDNKQANSPKGWKQNYIPWDRKPRKKTGPTSVNKHMVMTPEAFAQSQKKNIILALKKSLVRPKNRIAKLDATIALLEKRPITYAHIRAIEERLASLKQSVKEANQEIGDCVRNWDALMTDNAPVAKEGTYSRKLASLEEITPAVSTKNSPTAPRTLDTTSATHIATLVQTWLDKGIPHASCNKLLLIYLGLEEFLTPDGIYPSNCLHLISKRLFSHHTRTLIELMEKSGSFSFLVSPDRTACYGCFSTYRIDRKVLRGNTDVVRSARHIQVAPHTRMTSQDEPSIANFETQDKGYILLDRITNINEVIEHLSNSNPIAANSFCTTLTSATCKTTLPTISDEPKDDSKRKVPSEGGKKERSEKPRKAVVADRRHNDQKSETPDDSPTESSPKALMTAATAPHEVLHKDMKTNDAANSENEGCANGDRSVAEEDQTDGKNGTAYGKKKCARRKLPFLPLLKTPDEIEAAKARAAIDYGSAADFFQQLKNGNAAERRFLRSIEEGLKKNFRVNSPQASLMMNYLLENEMIPYFNRQKKFHQTKHEGRVIWLHRFVDNPYFARMKEHAYKACLDQIRALEAENARRIAEQENLTSQRPSNPEQKD